MELSKGVGLAVTCLGLAPVATMGVEWLLFDTAFTVLQLLGIGLTVFGAALRALRH